MTVEPQKPRRRWLIPLLVLSLAANLFFIGLIGGSKLRGGDRGPRDGRMVGMLERALSDARADELAALRSSMRSLRREGREVRRESMRDMMRLMRAETFDREAFEAAQGAMRDHRSEHSKMRSAAFTDFIGTLTQEERIKVAELFEKRFQRRRGFR